MGTLLCLIVFLGGFSTSTLQARTSTRLTISNPDPITANTGEEITIKGSLVDGRGNGLPDKDVYLVVNGKTVQHKRSNGVGNFRFFITAQGPGEYICEVQFRGNSRYSPSSDQVKLRIPTPTAITFVKKIIEPPKQGQFIARFWWKVTDPTGTTAISDVGVTLYQWHPTTSRWIYHGGGHSDENGIVAMVSGYLPVDYGKTFTYRAVASYPYSGQVQTNIKLR